MCPSNFCLSQRRYNVHKRVPELVVSSQRMEESFDPCTISLPCLIYCSTRNMRKGLCMRLGSLHAVVCQ